MPNTTKQQTYGIWRNFAKGLTKRKMRWQKGPLESGDLDENGELAETFIAFF